MIYVLTPKQSGLAACLIDGLSYRDAAEALGASKKAVNRRAQRLRAQFGEPSNRTLVRRLRAMYRMDEAQPLNRPLGDGEPNAA